MACQNLVDEFGRTIKYLRMSVTDRCDLRCNYCMGEAMQFMPRRELLDLDELVQVADAFIARGVNKIRLTGGEPLVRAVTLPLIDELGTRLGTRAGEPGLDELTMTTNATNLARHATRIAAAGVKRLNVSLDTRDAQKFRALTNRDMLDRVLAGIDAALDAGIRIKLNTVALADTNREEIPELTAWAHGKGMDITFIEVMPLGDIAAERSDQFLSLETVRRDLEARYTLNASSHVSGGPARYWDVPETGGRIGFISPISHNFCASCNRVRVTAKGELFPCLGHGELTDLRAAVRGDAPQAALDAALDRAMKTKPERHHFQIAKGAQPTLARHMSVTGG